MAIGMAQIKEVFGRVYVKSEPIRRWLLDLFFPIFCIGCGSEGEFLCDACFATIKLRKDCAVFKNGATSGNKKTRDGIYDSEHYLDALFAACEYEHKSLLNRAIHTFKYDFVKDLANPLSRLLENALNTIDFSSPHFVRGAVIVPVPLHKKRFKWRGFNQAEMLAKNLCVANGLEMGNPLERVTFNRPQMELKKEDRLKNVESAFVVKYAGNQVCTTTERIAGVPEKILLIDDVATTASTLNACAKALKNAGAKQVVGLVLARVN
jgi:competence protein ComFC